MLISAADIIKDSCNLCAKNWRRLISYLVCLTLPAFILSLLGAVSALIASLSSSISAISAIVILVVFTAGLLFSLWATIALAKEIGSLWKKQPETDWKSIFASASPLIWPVIYTSIMVALIVLIGTILLIIPGVIFAIWYFFAFYAVVFDGEKGAGAMRKSKSLVAGRWLSIAWRALAPGAFFGLITLAAQYLILTPLNVFISNQMANVITISLVNSIISVIFTPLTTAAMVILYFNAKENPLEEKPIPPAGSEETPKN